MTRKKKTGIEWAGGVAVMPGYVTGEGEPYRPEALLWLDDNQLVLGVETEKPGEVLARASASLAETMAKPMVEKADAPTRIRVATNELAETLRAAPKAYPWPVVVDPDLVARPPTAKEVTISEAICLSLMLQQARSRSGTQALQPGQILVGDGGGAHGCSASCRAGGSEAAGHGLLDHLGERDPLSSPVPRGPYETEVQRVARSPICSLSSSG